MARWRGLVAPRGPVSGERTWAACAIDINTLSPHQCVTGALVCLKLAFSNAALTQGFMSQYAFVFKASVYFYLFICLVFFGLGQRISLVRVASFLIEYRKIRKNAFITMKMHAAKFIFLEM